MWFRKSKRKESASSRKREKTLMLPHPKTIDHVHLQEKRFDKREEETTLTNKM